jgi:tRNA pseudouridine38-40 synthase
VFRHSGYDDAPDAEVWLEVVGNGFLYNMVRIITGSLVMVGSGKRRPEWIREVIAARSRPAAGPTAPPKGLVLVSIDLDLDMSHRSASSNPAPAWQESPNNLEN